MPESVRHRIVRYAIVGVIVVVVGAVYVQRQAGSRGDAALVASDGAASGALTIGQPVPDFSLETRDGRVRLSELRGSAVIVNFWASWCGPCREEMPLLQRVHDAHAETGDLIVLAVNVASADARNAADAFIEEFGLTFPVAFDVTGEVTQRYGVLGLPASFFVDADGVLRTRTFGPLFGDLLAEGLASVGFTEG